MKFDPMAPERETRASSRGVHELKLWTTFARKLGWAEPWFELWWLVPLTGKSRLAVRRLRASARRTSRTSQQGGVAFGLEVYALDNRADQTRDQPRLSAAASIAHFEGREYTEMWEVFALRRRHPRRGGPLDPRRRPDATPTSRPAQPPRHLQRRELPRDRPAGLRVRAQIGPHVRFAVIADLVWKTDHAISFADAGVDLPTAAADRDCETTNDLVNPGTDEVNPLHVPTIDLVGHRYRSEDGFGFVIGVSGQVLF